VDSKIGEGNTTGGNRRVALEKNIEDTANRYLMNIPKQGNGK
jgi:hypothetical protein